MMDSKSLQKKFDKLLQETREITLPILDRVLEKPDEALPGEIVGEDGIIYEPCGTSEEIPKLDPVEIEEAQRSTDQINTEIEENPFEYPEAAQARGANEPGDTAGDKAEKIQLLSVGKPNWVKELKGLVKGFGKPTRKRGKTGYDIESLVRGVVEKEREKVKQRGDLVFTIIDTSGSMTMTAVTGRSYLQEMIKYVQPIVEDYDGEVILGDTDVRAVYENKYARKAFKESKAMSAVGGGGTTFDGMFNYILKRKRAEKFECLVVVLTDGGVRIDPAQMQELGSMIMVVPKEEAQTFSNFNSGTTMDMFQSQKFPLMKLLRVDFRVE